MTRIQRLRKALADADTLQIGGWYGGGGYLSCIERGSVREFFLQKTPVPWPVSR
jgi:hypothetical protein